MISARSWVSIGGYRSAGIKISTSRAITARNRLITRDDVEHLCLDAKNKITIPEDFEILHEKLQYFLLDGENEVSDPQGMTADNMSASLYLILTPSAVISNVRNALANADIQSIEGMELQQVASGFGVLSPDEMELGVVHINMGWRNNQPFCYPPEPAAPHNCPPDRRLPGNQGPGYYFTDSP